MNITNEDVKMARYIWDILKSQPVIIMSWGLDLRTVKPISPLGIEFHVQGFIHTGLVKINLDEATDTFTVSLIPDCEGDAVVLDDVYLDNLVSVIDGNVEKTEDYQKRLSEGGYDTTEIVIP